MTHGDRFETLLGFGIRRPTGDGATQILVDQVAIARRQYLVIGVGAAVGALVVVFSFRDMVAPYVLVPWALIAAFTGVSSIRAGIRQRRAGDRQPKDAFRSARKILWRSWLAAAFWGATYFVGAIVSHQTDNGVLAVPELISLLFAAGTAAGLISVMGMIPLLWAPMTILLLIPVAVASALSGHDESALVAIVLALFVSALFFTGANAHASYVRNAQLRERAARLAAEKTAAEADLAQFFERTNTLLAIIEVGSGGKFVRANPIWSQILGYAPSEIVGRYSREFIHPDDMARAHTAFVDVLAGTDVTGLILRYRSKAGPYRWLQWNVTYDAATRHAFCTASDVTEREQSRTLKEQLVSTVSHELRTPLTSLKASLGLLAAGLAADSSARDRLIEIADRNADRLTTLTNDFLDLERHGATRYLDIEACPLSEIVGAAVADLAPVLEPTGVACVVHDALNGATVTGDRDRIGQVVNNLLSNAFKFAPVNSEIRIDLDICGDVARVAVADRGEGLPHGTAGSVFERFVQVNTPKRGVGGSGLGLAISKELIDAMGGTIGVDSIPGHGATFFFELPLAPATGGAATSTLGGTLAALPAIGLE